MIRIRISIFLVCVVCCLLVLKDAQPVASASPEKSDLEIVAGITSERLVGAPQLAIDWSFLEDDANSKELQVMIAPDICFSVELLTDLIAMDMTVDTITVSNYCWELNGNNPKRLHDIAMLLLKKLCETDYAELDQEGVSSLMQYSEAFIAIIEANLRRDYIALFQGYMFAAVIHNFGDAWFGMCCRKAFNLADAHEDLERKDLVTQFVLGTQFLCKSAGTIERILRQQAAQSQDYRFLNYIRTVFGPLPYIHPSQYQLSSDSDPLISQASPPPYKKNSTKNAGLITGMDGPPTYAEAKKALSLNSKPIK